MKVITKDCHNKVYNTTKNQVQELCYPREIRLNERADKVAEKARGGDDWDREWAGDILSAGIRHLEKCPVVRPSAQAEGGFILDVDPDYWALVSCTYDRGSNKPWVQGLMKAGRFDQLDEKQIARSRFGFHCRPVTQPEIGPNNWLYGHYYNPNACSLVWDRENLEVVNRTKDMHVSGFNSRYICAVSEEEIREYDQRMKEALKCIKDYEDQIGFSAEIFEGMQPGQKFDSKDLSREIEKRAKTEEEKQALMDWFAWMTESEMEDPDAIVKVMRKKYGFLEGW